MWSEQMLNKFRANLPVLMLSAPSAEEDSVVQTIYSRVAEELVVPVFLWDIAKGVREVLRSPDGSVDYVPSEAFDDLRDPLSVLQAIDRYQHSGIFVMRDLDVFLRGPKEDAETIRYLLNLTDDLKVAETDDPDPANRIRLTKRIVVTGQDIRLRSEFVERAELLVFDLPNVTEMTEAANVAIANIAAAYRESSGVELPIELSPEDRIRLVRAGQGLTRVGFEGSLREAVVTYRCIDDRAIKLINAKKVSKLANLGIEFSDPPATAVGGCDLLMRWIDQRTPIFNAQVSGEEDLPPAKGIVLIGPPGTGKSLFAKSISHRWGIPNIRADIGALFSSDLGSTEANFRSLMSIAEAIAPCVLWIDEIDKAFGGVTGPSGDSGTTQRAFGSFLTWMTEKKAPVFVIATANRTEGLPGELLRKGRFDEIFRVGYPNTLERSMILDIHAKRWKVNLSDKDLQELAAATPNWSGSELETLLTEGVIQCYGGKPCNKAVLLDLAKDMVPLYETMQADIQRMMESCRSARPASVEEKVAAKTAKSRNAAGGMTF